MVSSANIGCTSNEKFGATTPPGLNDGVMHAERWPSAPKCHVPITLYQVNMQWQSTWRRQLLWRFVVPTDGTAHATQASLVHGPGSARGKHRAQRGPPPLVSRLYYRLLSGLHRGGGARRPHDSFCRVAARTKSIGGSTSCKAKSHHVMWGYMLCGSGCIIARRMACHSTSGHAPMACFRIDGNASVVVRTIACANTGVYIQGCTPPRNGTVLHS